jgi:hypothetical protein
MSEHEVTCGTYVEAAERYERLYWALKAKRALNNYGWRDSYSRERPEVCEGETIAFEPSPGRYSRRWRIRYNHSTLPGQRIMGDWERDILDRQRALCPLVEPSDVKRARTRMIELRTEMRSSVKTAQREMALS